MDTATNKPVAQAETRTNQRKRKDSLRPYLVRLVIISVFSILFTAVFNEVVYRMQKDEYDRAPQTIQLVIPDGASEKIAAGDPIPSIPAEMVFVVGDVLEVKNEDQTQHQLGPIWVPAGSSASLVMKQVDKLAYSCSFQTSRYLGVDVRQPTTIMTRVTALGLAAPTTAALLYLYSFLIFPIKSKEAALAVSKLERT